MKINYKDCHVEYRVARRHHDKWDVQDVEVKIRGDSPKSVEEAVNSIAGLLDNSKRWRSVV